MRTQDLKRVRTFDGVNTSRRTVDGRLHDSCPGGSVGLKHSPIVGLGLKGAETVVIICTDLSVDSKQNKLEYSIYGGASLHSNVHRCDASIINSASGLMFCNAAHAPTS